MRIAVVGGGVVGLCCAYELAARGADVTVLERGRVGHGTSLGNTGWVCPTFTYPLPGPGVVSAGLKGLLAGGGPLVIHPSLDPAFVRWLWLFRRSSSRSRWERGVAAFVGLNARTLELFDAYADAGVEFEMHRSGLLLVARTEDGLADYARMFEEIGRFGYEGQIERLGPAEACELEPALDRRRVTGGMHTLIDRYVRPESLTAGLAAFLRERGTDVREGVQVTSMKAEVGGVRLLTGGDPVVADRVVVAAGPSSRPLLTALGVRVPLVGARGYSVTIAGGAVRPRHALYLAEAKVGISSYEDSVRIAGVFELGHRSDTLDRRRLAAMIADCEPVLRRLAPGGRAGRRGVGGPAPHDRGRPPADRRLAGERAGLPRHRPRHARRHARPRHRRAPRPARPRRRRAAGARAVPAGPDDLSTGCDPSCTPKRSSSSAATA